MTVTGTKLPKAYTGDDLRQAIISDFAKVKGSQKVIFLSNAANAKLASGDGAVSAAILLGQTTFGAKAMVPTLKSLISLSTLIHT